MTGARAAVDGTPHRGRWHRVSTPASTIGPWLPEGALGASLAEGLARVESALSDAPSAASTRSCARRPAT